MFSHPSVTDMLNHGKPTEANQPFDSFPAIIHSLKTLDTGMSDNALLSFPWFTELLFLLATKCRMAFLAVGVPCSGFQFFNNRHEIASYISKVCNSGIFM